MLIWERVYMAMSQPYMSTSHKQGIKAYMSHIKIWHIIYKQWPGNAPRHILTLSIERREVHKNGKISRVHVSPSPPFE